MNARVRGQRLEISGNARLEKREEEGPVVRRARIEDPNSREQLCGDPKSSIADKPIVIEVYKPFYDA